MNNLKKRSLNELRQTKDTYYVVPKIKRTTVAEQAFKEYFQNGGNEIHPNNISNFLTFLKENKFKISKK